MTKKLFLVAIVFSVAWFGVEVGQTLTSQVMRVTALQNSVAFAADEKPADKPGATASDKKQSSQDKYQLLELFQKVLHFVEANYVEEPKSKDLIYGAIKGMLETLDPHSNFLTPEIFKDMKIDTSGKFGGLGIEIGMKENILTIISPIEDTPAWKAGLKPNDRIVKISNESTKGMNLMEAVSKMRGKKGTDVTLSVYREGWDKIRDITVTRDIIKIQSVKSETLEPEYGYVRLTQFNESAAQDIKKALDKMENEKKLKGLVFDLRYNPGGLLDQAVEVSSLFIDEGVVVSTIGRDKNQKEVKYARKGNARKELLVAILVNSSTASASEIVAGALQDHHRAIIMGQPTFGKGSVQTVVELGQDIGLKLTIARYYTPSGISIQEKGVNPDILLDDYDQKLLAEAKRKLDPFREKDLKGHIVNTDDSASKEKKSSDDFKKDELDAMTGKKDSKKKSGKDSKDKNISAEDEDLTPVKMNPKEDYQVKEALNYLKSFETFKKISGADRVKGQSSAPGSAAKVMTE